MADENESDLVKWRAAHEGGEDEVKCARCGKWINMQKTRCPHCGVHFSGRALQFSHESDRHLQKEGQSGKIPRWVVVIAMIVIGMLLVGIPLIAIILSP